MNIVAEHWAELSLVFAAFVLAVGSPGPSNLAIMATSMNAGRQAALVLALGVTAGSITWGILAALGISAMLAAYAPALLAVKIAGGCYLLFLALRSARSALQAQEPAATPGAASGPGWRTFWRGYLMHLTNPKAILNWTAIMALGLGPAMPLEVVIAMLAGCFAISLAFNCGYAMLFSTAVMVRGYRRARRAAEGTFAVFFTVAGLKLLTSR